MPKPQMRQKHQYLFGSQLKEEQTPLKLQIGLTNAREKEKDETGETEAFNPWHPALIRDFYHRQMLHIPKPFKWLKF